MVRSVNGLPLAVRELKNATLWTAFQQLQNYKAEIPALFNMNAVLVVSEKESGNERRG